MSDRLARLTLFGCCLSFRDLSWKQKNAQSILKTGSKVDFVVDGVSVSKRPFDPSTQRKVCKHADRAITLLIQIRFPTSDLRTPSQPSDRQEHSSLGPPARSTAGADSQVVLLSHFQLRVSGAVRRFGVLDGFQGRVEQNAKRLHGGERVTNRGGERESRVESNSWSLMSLPFLSSPKAIQASPDVNPLSSQDDYERAIESLRASTINCPRYSSDDQFTSPRGRWIKDDWVAYYIEVSPWRHR